MAWTEKQQQAIDIRNKGIIVSAAAGSGKTSVLVERLVRQLSDDKEDIPADRMIIVTFTNAAAAQMRRRLMNEFSRQIAADPENLRLAEQYSKLETAKIATISSFCFDLIRDNIDSVDLPPDFRIMEENEQELIIRDAINDVFEKWYSDRPQDMELLNGMFCDSDDAPLEELMTELLRFMSVLPFPDHSAKQICEIFSETDPDKNIFGREYAEYVLAKLEKSEQLAKNAKSLADSFMKPDSKAYEKLAAEFGVIFAAADEMRAALAEKNFVWDRIFSSPHITEAKDFSFPAVTVKTKKDDYDDEAVERLKAIRNSYKDKFKGFRELLLSREEAADDLAVHGTIVPLLMELYRSVSDCLWQKKLEKGAVSFSDGEQLAVRLLAEISPEGEVIRTELCRRISEFYKIIMIDEFQDVNDAQNMLFRLLSHEGSAERAGDNIFCVGDVKQAIYGFRQANPAIFTEVLHSSEEYSDECKAKNVSVSLNKNFRSSIDVVDFVNYIFRRTMSRSVGGIDYTDSEALVCGAQYNDRPRLAELIIADGDAAESASAAEAPDDDSSSDSEEENLAEAAVEAEAAAIRISEMIKSGAPVYENGADRPCTPKDFCILLRGKAAAGIFADSLAARGIKSVSESSPAYLDSWEISVMLNLLRVVDNPLVDIPVLSVLMSPMFGFDAGDAAELESFSRRIRPNGGDPVYVKLTLLLSSYHRAGWKLFAKAEAFMQTITSLRQYISRASVWELVTHIYNSTAFMSVMQASGNGQQKCANLRLLTEYIKSYETSSGGGLSGFLRYIDSLKSHKKDLPSAATVSASADAVQIYTIHKSKGLEFPFVFLCRGFHGFNKQDLKKQTLFDRQLGISFRIRRRDTLQRYPSMPFDVLKKRKETELISEEMRLLYVALTRAREQLFITFPEGDKLRAALEKCGEYALSGYSDAAGADCFSDWILGALSGHDDFRAMYGETVRKPSLFAVRRIKCGGEVRENVHEEEKAALPDPAVIGNIRKLCGFRYDSSQSELAAKLTVTEIAKSEQKVVLSENIFDLPDSPKKISAAERGSAHHTFMQYADFALAEEDIEAAILSVCDRGYISEEEAAELDRKRLKAFFESSLYDRLKNSLKIMREKKFLVKISDLSLDDELGKVYNQTNGMLQGIADALFFEEDGVVLIDYKTDRGVSEKVLADRYGMQLRLYSEALGLILETPVKEAYIYSFSLSKAIAVEI